MWLDEASPIGICGQSLRENPPVVTLQFDSFRRPLLYLPPTASEETVSSIEAPDGMDSQRLLSECDHRLLGVLKYWFTDIFSGVLEQDPLYRPTQLESSLLWRYRNWARKFPEVCGLGDWVCVGESHRCK